MVRQGPPARVTASPDQRASLRRLPNWDTIPQAARRQMELALCALQYTSVEDIGHVPDMVLCDRLGASITRHHVRLGMGMLMRAVGRTWDIRYGPKTGIKVQPTLSPEQQKLVESLLSVNATANQRHAVRNGVLCLGVSSMEQLCAVPFNQVREVLAAQSTRWNAFCIRTVLRRAGRSENFDAGAPLVIATEKSNVWVSHSESRWLKANPVVRDSFIKLKGTFTDWLVGQHGNSNRFAKDMPAHAMLVCRQLPLHMIMDTGAAAQADWLNAIVEAVLLSIAHPNSLASQRRQSRGPKVKANEAGYEASRSYAAALRSLHKHLGLSESYTPSHLAVWRTVQQRRVTQPCDLRPVHDVLTMDEMERVLAAAVTRKERCITLLLCRLGMRIGAVRRLRLAGVVEAVAPAPAVWVVRRFISGIDKNGQTNQWDTEFDPAVRHGIESYLHEEWRQQWERWVSAPGGDSQLQTMWLFPALRKTTTGATKPMSNTCLTRLVGTLLHRAAVHGPHAHAHSFRKGVVTGLIKSGNPLHFVSRFVHHKTTAVTENSYVKLT